MLRRRSQSGSSIASAGKMREASIEAVVTRADGTVEQLGVVSYYHRNPVRRVWWRVTHRKER